MRAAVVDLLQPRPQPNVQIVQTGNQAFIEFAEKLIATGAMPTF
jgi:hypothetical protein